MNDEALWRRLDSGIQEVLEYVVPLSEDHRDGEGIKHVGSAVVTGIDIGVEQQVVILTAAHNMSADTTTTHLHGDRRTERFAHDVVRLDGREDVTVDIDVAHVLLNHREVDRLSIGRALDLAKVPLNLPTDPATEWVVIGFPSSRSDTDRPRRQINTEQIVLVANEAGPDVYTQLGTRRDVHVVLQYDIRRVRRREAPGESLGVHPSGMSGGGIFFVRADNQLELAAIYIEFRRAEGVLIGTRLPIILESLREHYSNLAPHLPRASDFAS